MGQSTNNRARPGPNILHHWCYLQEELDPPLKTITSNGPFASVLKPIILYLITGNKTLILLMKFLVFIFVPCKRNATHLSLITPKLMCCLKRCEADLYLWKYCAWWGSLWRSCTARVQHPAPRLHPGTNSRYLCQLRFHPRDLKGSCDKHFQNLKVHFVKSSTLTKGVIRSTKIFGTILAKYINILGALVCRLSFQSSLRST